MIDDDLEPKPKKESMSLAEMAEKADAKAAEVSRGIMCPKCGCRDWRVVYKRPLTAGREQRRRACRNCGHRVTTTEKVIG